MEIMNIPDKKTISTLELVKQINFFRKQEGNRAELQHYDLLKIIRDEFEEEIGVGKISASSYRNSQNKEQPMYQLTHSQSKQVLMRESKYVRKAMIYYIEELEKAINKPLSVQEMMILTLQEQQKQGERLNIIENKVENEIRIDHGEQRKIQKAVGVRVYQRMDILQNYENKKLMFQSLYRELKNRFGVASYRDIKRKDLQDVLLYISSWIEPIELKTVA